MARSYKKILGAGVALLVVGLAAAAAYRRIAKPAVVQASSTNGQTPGAPEDSAMVETRSLAAELAVLRKEVMRRNVLPILEPTQDWLATEEMALAFTDYNVRLLEPPSGRRLRPGSEIRLYWTTVPFDGVNYFVDIAGSMEFSGTERRVSKSDRLSVHLSRPGFYFWRVRAALRGKSVVSNVHTFEVR